MQRQANSDNPEVITQHQNAEMRTRMFTTKHQDAPRKRAGPKSNVGRKMMEADNGRRGEKSEAKREMEEVEPPIPKPWTLKPRGRAVRPPCGQTEPVSG